MVQPSEAGARAFDASIHVVEGGADLASPLEFYFRSATEAHDAVVGLRRKVSKYEAFLKDARDQLAAAEVARVQAYERMAEAINASPEETDKYVAGARALAEQAQQAAKAVADHVNRVREGGDS